MKFFLIAVFSLLISNSCWSQTEFIKPWDNEKMPIVVDVYWENSYKINDLKKDKRVAGVIHKMSKEDSSTFYKRRTETYKNGLLFGSYWLPKYDSNGTAQADQYLKMVGNSFSSKEFIALDFERHKVTKQFISPYNSFLFVKRVFEKTGRYPYIYCGLDNLNKLLNSEYKGTFKKCKLWIIALTNDGDISKTFKNNKVWSTYSLWQFSCEINCCKGAKRPCFYKILGVDCYMDYDVFNGTQEELADQWAK